MERAIQLHQGLLARRDLTRAERAHALACLGTDFRKAGFLDRAAQTFDEVLDVDPGNIHALVGQQKLHEEQRQWSEAYEAQTRLSRLRKTDDSLVLGYLQAEMGRGGARGRAAGGGGGARSGPRSRSTAACSPRTSAWPTSRARGPAPGGGHARGRDRGRRRSARTSPSTAWPAPTPPAGSRRAS